MFFSSDIKCQLWLYGACNIDFLGYICYNQLGKKELKGFITMNKVLKIVGKILLIMLAVLLLFVLGTFIVHSVKSEQALELLKEKGI